MSKDKALIKKTGETLNVESNYIVKHFTATFTYDLSEEQIDEIREMTFVHDSEPKEEGEYYTLSNGEVYHEKDVIVGLDNIREENLKKII